MGIDVGRLRVVVMVVVEIFFWLFRFFWEIERRVVVESEGGGREEKGLSCEFCMLGVCFVYFGEVFVFDFSFSG